MAKALVGYRTATDPRLMLEPWNCAAGSATSRAWSTGSQRGQRPPAGGSETA